MISENEWISKFHRYLIEERRSQNTVDTYLLEVELWMMWLQEKEGQIFHPVFLTKDSIQRYVDQLTESLSPSTVNKKIAVLKSFCKFLQLKGHLNFNPAERVKSKRHMMHLLSPEWLDQEEQEKLKIILESDSSWLGLRNKAIIYCMWFAGLRISEAIQLTIKDIDFQTKRLIVRKGKGAKLRHVWMNESLIKSLQDWLTIKEDDSPFLFTSSRKTPIQKRTVQEMVEKFGKAINVHLHAHRFRHTFCKSLLDKKVPLHIVAQLAGHDSLDTTRRYGQPSEKEMLDAVELLH